MGEKSDLKWSLPGWRIESRYNNNVLIGNWSEERRNVSTAVVFDGIPEHPPVKFDTFSLFS